MAELAKRRRQALLEQQTLLEHQFSEGGDSRGNKMSDDAVSDKVSLGVDLARSYFWPV
jgi:hypothetical protein